MKHTILMTMIFTVLSLSAGGAAGAGQLATSPNAQASLASAERALERGHVTQAIAMLTRQQENLRSDGDIARNASLLCRAYHQQQRLDLAVDACTVAIETHAASWSDYNNRGAALLILGDTRAAINDLHKANTLRRGVAAVQRNLARANSLNLQAQTVTD